MDPREAARSMLQKHSSKRFDSQKFKTAVISRIVSSNFSRYRFTNEPVELIFIPYIQDWEKVMKLRRKTVLVSFGSVAQSFLMPDEMKRSMLKTFDEFPDVTFIWKYEMDEDNIAEGHSNVVTSKWLPQNDILGPRRGIYSFCCCFRPAHPS